MAKNNNLTDYLTDLANAIREKKGTTDPINPQDFSAEIASIETGGGGEAVAENDVNFRDYDGTIVHSYTKAQFLALSALPELPTQPGLICQGWNYTLADAQSYVQEYGVLEVGATYITDDGKTRLYIRIADTERRTISLYFSQTVTNGVTIDFGDGTSKTTLSGTGNVNLTRTYRNMGDYVITLDVAEGCTLGFGHASSSYCIMGSTANTGRVICNMLTKVEVGERVKIRPYAFYNCCSLSSITIPQGVTYIDAYAFQYCYSLASIVIPQDMTSINTYAFQYCYSLASVVISQSVTSIGSYAFYACYSLASITIPQGVANIDNNLFYACYSLPSIVIPQGVTRIGSDVFNACHSLSSVVIPQGVTYIGSGVFRSCSSLSSVVIPKGVTSIGSTLFRACYSLPSIVIPQSVTTIGAEAFYDCSGVALFDFTACTQVPSLYSSSVFGGTMYSNYKIKVPNSLYESWKAATNWSALASKIISD